MIVSPGVPPEGLLPADTEVPVRQIGQWTMIWYRFKRHRMAVIGAWIALAMILLAIVGPLVAPPFVHLDKFGQIPLWAYRQGNQPPSLRWPFIMGTDAVGDPVVTYVLVGGRPLLAIGIGGAVLASVLGVLFGGLAGYLGSVVDAILMRLVDALLAIPFLLFLVLLASYIPDRTLLTYILLFGLAGWPGVARLVRGYALSLREREYVDAARALGNSTWGILARHILPNALDVIVVSFTLNVAIFIMTEVTLDYLGAGAGSALAASGLGSITWGTLLTSVSPLGGYWWQLVFPGLALLLTVLAANFLGDGLRDAFDATSATALVTEIPASRAERGSVDRSLAAVSGALGRGRERVTGVLAPLRPSHLWSRIGPQRAIPSAVRTWAGRERSGDERAAPLLLCLLPLAALFAVLGVVFLYGHSPLMYSPHYALPSALVPVEGDPDYGAWARRSGGWDIFTVDGRRRLAYLRVDRQGRVVLDRSLGPGDSSDEPAMTRGMGRTLGVWLADQGQVVRAAYPARRRLVPISLNPAGGVAEDPNVTAVPGGFDVLFDWQPPGGSAFDIELASIPAGGAHPSLRRLTRTGDYGTAPHAIADGSGALDLIYLRRRSPGLWSVLFQRFTAQGKQLGGSQTLGSVTYLTPGPNGCSVPDVVPTHWAIDLKRTADGSVWGAWEEGNDCVSRGGVSGANTLYVGHWSRSGRVLLPPTAAVPGVDASGQAVALALQGTGGVLYYAQPGTYESYLTASAFNRAGGATAPERVTYEGGGTAADPHAQAVRGDPAVIWEKASASSAILETTTYHPARPPDLLTHLGLNIGNLWGNLALILFGSLAGGIVLTLINVFLLLPLAVVWLLVRRLPGRLRWPLYLAAIALLLGWSFARSSLPGYVLVITAFTMPYGWLAVAGAVVASAWSGRYLFSHQESAMRATAMALVALYVVAVLYSLLFVQSQITRI